jgi:elongation factor 4
VERERGITVKAQTASMFYDYNDRKYLLNLIDTPGHIDFSYEVSRSLSACQGVILLVDATQGVQAQTVANYMQAVEAGLVVVPVINKIDLKTADVVGVSTQMNDLFGIEEEDILRVSAKTGHGVESLMGTTIQRIPSPVGCPDAPLSMLLVDSWFERYRGVVCLVCVTEGTVARGVSVVSAHNRTEYTIQDIGLRTPTESPTTSLRAGQVGYVVMGMKSPEEARVGDTFGEAGSSVQPLPLIKPAKPVVFAGIFPSISEDYETLKSAIGKLVLNDSSVTVQQDTSVALGQGWKLGFLGLLHMDIFMQRLEQEHNTTCILTSPSVHYKAILRKNREELNIYTSNEFPEKAKVFEYLEPVVMATIITPDEYVGKVIDLAMYSRGEQLDMRYIGSNRVLFKYKFPLAEIIVDFYDKLKSLSSGYASFDYEESGYEAADLVKLDILLNGSQVDVLACIVHRSKAYTTGKSICSRLQEVIHRQLYDVAIQAAVGGKVIARETVKATRKDVTAKCYGGDITRKRKLLERQREGKKKLKKIGRIELPKEAFISVLRKPN